MDKQRKDLLIGYLFWGTLAVLGVCLLINPDWAVAFAVKLAGWVCMAIGIGFIISMIVDRELNRVGKWVLAILGIGISAMVIAFPLTLADAITRFFGLLLVNIATQNLRESPGGFHRGVAVATGIAGVVLILVPRTLTHTLLGAAGSVLIIVGAVNIWSLRQNSRRIEAGERSTIIDADE